MKPWSRAERWAAWPAAVALALLAGARAGAQTTGSQAPKVTLGVVGSFTPAGMLIANVVAGSAADRAGLQQGDLILKMDGDPVRNQQAFARALEASGGQVRLLVRRAATGRVERVTADLAGGDFPAPYLLGVVGRYTPQGMLVGVVGRGTAAAKVGIQPGDLLARVNGQLITDQKALYQALYNSGGAADLLVVKGGTGRQVRLQTFLRVYRLGALGDFTPQGLLVRLVAPGTPAAKAGLRPGDVIARINDRFLRNQDDFLAVVGASLGRATLLVLRGPGGAAARMTLSLMNNPLGAWCEVGAAGLHVTAVVPGTPADKAGLVRGDVIVRVDDQRVRTQDELLRALGRVAGGQTTLSVRRAQTGRVDAVAADLSR
jgi:S1-C subfamily serine protease